MLGIRIIMRCFIFKCIISDWKDDLIQFAESNLKQASILSGNKFLNNLYKHAITKLKVDSDDYEKLEELNDLLRKMKKSEEKVKVMSQLVYPDEKLIEATLQVKKKSKRQKSSLPSSPLPASPSSTLKSKRLGDTEKHEKKSESYNYDSKPEPVSRSYASKYARFMEGRTREPSHSSSSLTKSRSKSRVYEDDEEDIETYSPSSERTYGREKSKTKLRKRL